MNLKEQMSLFNLKKRDMNHVKAGGDCGCSCYYADSGGSSQNWNCNTNLDGGKTSIKGKIVCTGSQPDEPGQ
jgi:natural product precursor